MDYCERYAQGAWNVQKETFAPVPVVYDTETAKKVQEEFQSSLPLEKLNERRQWRNAMLARLAKLKRDVKEQTEK